MAALSQQRYNVNFIITLASNGISKLFSVKHSFVYEYLSALLVFQIIHQRRKIALVDCYFFNVFSLLVS